MPLNPAQTARPHTQTDRPTSKIRLPSQPHTEAAATPTSSDTYNAAKTNRVKLLVAKYETPATQSAPQHSRSNSSQNRLQAKLAKFKEACEAPKNTASEPVSTQTNVSSMVENLDKDAARSPDVIISDQVAQKEKNLELEKAAAEFWAQDN